MAFISRLAEMIDPAPPSSAVEGSIAREPIGVLVQISGHKQLGQLFEQLEGGIRGAASLGARNAARSMMKLARQMVPYDTGELWRSGQVQKGNSGQNAAAPGGRKVGGMTMGIGVTGFDDPFADQDDNVDASPQTTFNKGITEWNCIFDADHAWFVHETEQNYHQDNPNAPATTERRGTKYLERAMLRVEPEYPDWVAAEIQKLIKPMSMAPRLKRRT